jgi:hypothetical protein
MYEKQALAIIYELVFYHQIKKIKKVCPAVQFLKPHAL